MSPPRCRHNKDLRKRDQNLNLWLRTSQSFSTSYVDARPLSRPFGAGGGRRSRGVPSPPSTDRGRYKKGHLICDTSVAHSSIAEPGPGTERPQAPYRPEPRDPEQALLRDLPRYETSRTSAGPSLPQAPEDTRSEDSRGPFASSGPSTPPCVPTPRRPHWETSGRRTPLFRARPLAPDTRPPPQPHEDEGKGAGCPRRETGTFPKPLSRDDPGPGATIPLLPQSTLVVQLFDE